MCPFPLVRGDAARHLRSGTENYLAAFRELPGAPNHNFTFMTDLTTMALLPINEILGQHFGVKPEEYLLFKAAETSKIISAPQINPQLEYLRLVNKVFEDASLGWEVVDLPLA